MATGTTDAALVSALTRWFDAHERPLPWRASSPWGVMVSEFMLQQTPVDRVLPAWAAWLERWPRPQDLAESRLADALRAWGRLGYPRRARFLHESAVIITEQHGGRVPHETGALRALPGVGEYTAAAIQAFAFGRRSIVLDTNVRRVLARVVNGVAGPAPGITSSERQRADLLWPARDARSARWSAAVMEFGALVCTARAPRCDQCPISGSCAWLAAGRPDLPIPQRRQAAYPGSDRHVRGLIMAVLRDSSASVARAQLAHAWSEPDQLDRALVALIDDGLVVRRRGGRYALPG